MANRRHILRRRRFGVILADNGGWMTASMIAEKMRGNGWAYGNVSGISHALRGSQGIQRIHIDGKMWFKMGIQAGYNNWLKRK